MRLSKTLCILVCFLLFSNYASGDESKFYFFKMNDGKTYVGEILPSDTSIFKIRQESGEILELPFDDVIKTGKFDPGSVQSTGVEQSLASKDEASMAKDLGTELEFGLMYYHVDYKEDATPPLKSTESGWLPGVYLGFNRISPGKVYYKAFLEFSSDELAYDGSTWGGTPVKETSSAEFFRFQFNLGYTVPIKDNILISPYLGYGYRSWDRGGKGPTSYDEFYKWQYFPVGIETTLFLNDKWSIQPTIEGRFMFSGSMKAKFSDPGFNEINVSLDNKTGYKFEMPIRYQFTKRWAGICTPWFSNSRIGESDWQTLTYYGVPVTMVAEPSSETQLYGFNFTFSYRFK